MGFGAGFGWYQTGDWRRKAADSAGLGGSERRGRAVTDALGLPADLA